MHYLIKTLAIAMFFVFGSCKQESGKTKVNLSAMEVKQLLESDQDIVILDVRTPSEFQQGHLEGAVNIDVTASSFESEISRLDKNATYVLYCRSGSRSSSATNIMARNEFPNLYNSTAGFEGLRSAGIQTR